MGNFKLSRTIQELLSRTFSVITVVLLVIPSSFAQVILPGLCPIAPAMSNLDVARYKGRWYEVEKYWFLPEATATCVAVNYFDNLAVEILQREEITRKTYVNPGTTRFLRNNGVADVILDLLVVQSPVPFSFPYRYKILDTDYSSYTIKYSCNQLGPINYQNIWILGRDKFFTPETREKIYSTLDRFGISTAHLKRTSHISCPW